MCSFRKQHASVTVEGYTTIDNEEDLMRAIGTKGPVAVTLDGSDRAFKFYKGGIYTSNTCSKSVEKINHGNF